jgi:GDP-L-fucose synthase
MKKTDKIYVAGHRGMVGSAIVSKLEKEGYTNLVLRTSRELDLIDQAAVQQFFADERPAYVFLAAARVGGIQANDTYRAEFIYQNIMIQTNVIHEAYRNEAKKLLFLGSTCIYPKHAPQPMPEDSLLTGPLEQTNEPYAIAKIAGIKMCESYNRQYGTNYISVMPTNLYGPNDNFDLETSHVLPALIRKFHDAKRDGQDSVEIWGTGKPRREFLHVDDLADACVLLMQTYSGSDIVNIGVGQDLSIRELAELVADVVGFKGGLVFNPNMPDGTPRKLVDVARITKLGWKANISLADGLRDTYAWFLKTR